MVSMPSVHFFRWTEQLKNSEFEVYWFDIYGAGIRNDKMNWVTQFVDWKKRWDFPGRYFLKKNFPHLFSRIKRINEKDLNKEFERVLNLVKPDIVHSFALYVSCEPIFENMKKHTEINWVYSSWGSDLYYFKNELYKTE